VYSPTTTVTAGAAPTLPCTSNAACPLEETATRRDMSNKKPTMNAGMMITIDLFNCNSFQVIT